MSKERFEVFGNIITDNEQMPNLLDNYQATIRLNEFNQRITELEEQLKNAIVPKFEIGQEVFVIIRNVVRKTSINSFRVFESNELSYYCKYVDGERMYLEFDENELFATKEEAESKLEELKG